MLRAASLVMLSLVALYAAAQDPVETDGDKYTIRLENERIRVLEYRDLSGEKTLQQYHPAFLLYALAPFNRTIALPNGNVIMREFRAGDVLYSEGQTHVGENGGETPTHVIMVKIKPDFKGVPASQ